MVRALTPAALERFPAAPRTLKELSELYEGRATDAFYLGQGNFSANREKARAQVEQATHWATAALYGEILPSAFVDMLAYVGARPGMRYYDLGSGYGKTVLLAGLLGFKATGVELVDQRWDEACRVLRRGGPELEHVSFVHGSFMGYDFSDADIAFADSLGFSDKMMAAVAQTARGMRPGAIVITAQGLTGDEFREVGIFEGDATFSPGTPWTVQEVVGPVDGTPRGGSTRVSSKIGPECTR